MCIDFTSQQNVIFYIENNNNIILVNFYSDELETTFEGKCTYHINDQGRFTLTEKVEGIKIERNSPNSVEARLMTPKKLAEYIVDNQHHIEPQNFPIREEKLSYKRIFPIL